MSNSPYILVLDCDMYCNDPTSARQAMCCHLDPKISPSLAFVQFPQTFRNISKDDIYDSEIRYIFKIQWQGLDGLRGPVLSGTNFYIKREALLGNSSQDGNVDLMALKRSFGPSNEFIKTLRRDFKPSFFNDGKSSSMLLEEAKFLASCSYQDQTTWGTEANLLIQGSRWTSGITEVAISKFCPLIYGLRRMSLLQSLAYAELAFWPLLYSLSSWGFAIIPQLCLLNGIPLYPEVSDPYFRIFLFIFISSLAKNLYEILMSGGGIRTWNNERRIWMIKTVTSFSYGFLDSIMNKLGLGEASFLPTNKVADDEVVKRYEMGIFDFRAPTIFLVPLVTIILVNIASFVGGVVRVMFMDSFGDWKKMVGQISLSFYILMVNYAVIEGMVIRKDKASIPKSVTLLSVVFSVLIFQAYLWKPISRKTFPERLLQEKLPGIDVFICTADPKKEPPLEVMNTVLSAMALDYPTGKLSVYVSDDGGSALTLHAMKEAWIFAKSWLPFCKKFGVKTRCPKVYFSRYEDECLGQKDGYEEELEKIKQKYKSFEEHVKKAESDSEMLEETRCKSNSKNYPAHVEVIQDEISNTSTETNQAKMPLLVYVSREKSPTYPHHFKAGALNVLLRVSSIISNSPYILVLDCDMRCNDPTSALQAMCFHLDPKLSPNLAFVQFPQKFHNLSKKDIYDGQLRSTFSVRWPGMDGLQGPMLSGTGFYLNRKALFGDIVQEDIDTIQLKQHFGPSNELLKSLRQNNHQNSVSSYWFMIFSYIFVMSQLKHLEEVLSTGDPIRTWWNEQRIWMMKALIFYTIGSVNAMLKLFGLREANFVPTNKVADDEQVSFYQKGIFNFQASTIVLAPLVTLVTLNMISFAGGVARVIIKGNWNEMFGQIVLSFYILMAHYPIIEGMLLRKDNGRIPYSVILLSLALSTSFLCLGSLILVMS
ncbi:Cellulose synthase [Corchorus capsularis]|uniref:Cellulose synthase n=1 Tax=Corchorus capsularis TaxID=210143 RepID=A0A1R3G9L1_COCAP|nr:Cellulose synthase [Corchorus capsularis]